MTKLNLFALKAQQQGKPDDKPATQPESPASEVAAASEPESAAPATSDNLVGDSAPPKTGLAFLKAVAPVASQPAQDASPKPSAGGLAFLAKGRIGTPKELQSTPPEASETVVPATQAAEPASEKSGLELLMESTASGGTLGAASRFADEIPATAPLRELPADMDAQARAFTGSLDSVYKALHEPELLGSVVRGIMIELANHPEYRKLISPMDYHTMVRGMRESMGLARIKKEESKAKRTPSKKSTVITDLDALNALEGMDFS
jgi:hypothetical protein